MDYLPQNDDQYKAWLANFVEKAGFYGATLGITAGELTQLDNGQNNFVTALNDWQLANLTARSARANKTTVRSATTAVVRAIAQQSRNANGATDAILIDMGLRPKSDGGTISPPSAPTSLVAVGLSTGINQLKWNKNGNKSGTQYIISARYGPADDWDIVGVTTKTKWDHLGQIPGTAVSYRVYAQRSELQSAVSNEAVVYAPGATLLSIAA